MWRDTHYEGHEEHEVMVVLNNSVLAYSSRPEGRSHDESEVWCRSGLLTTIEMRQHFSYMHGIIEKLLVKSISNYIYTN